MYRDERDIHQPATIVCCRLAGANVFCDFFSGNEFARKQQAQRDCNPAAAVTFRRFTRQRDTNEAGKKFSFH
jgi:hypothetical protein